MKRYSNLSHSEKRELRKLYGIEKKHIKSGQRFPKWNAWLNSKGVTK